MMMNQLNSLGFKIKLEPKPPSNVQQILLRQIIASGLVDQVARKWPQDQIPNNNDNWAQSKWNQLMLKKAYQSMSVPNKPVFIHPSSYIYKSSDNDNLYTNDMPYQPEFVVYYSLRKSETIVGGEKIKIREISK